jgi:guanylate cyclase
MVTVFFSEIVNFTDISREVPAEKVCDMLGRLYESFDTLATKHEVFKVETIGDAWMGVTNRKYLVPIMIRLCAV